MDAIYDKFLTNARLNLFASIDSYYLFKKKNIKIYTLVVRYQMNDRSKTKIKKVPIVLMIGALNSNFMQDSLAM